MASNGRTPTAFCNPTCAVNCRRAPGRPRQACDRKAYPSFVLGLYSSKSASRFALERRLALRVIAGISFGVVLPHHPVDAAAPVRTLLDEERERAEAAAADRAAERRDALRRGFDAVSAAAVRLDELAETCKEEDGLKTVSALAVKFNSDVVREGMLKIGRGMGGEDQKAVESICKRATDALVGVSRSARKGDLAATLSQLEDVRAAMETFQTLRP